MSLQAQIELMKDPGRFTRLVIILLEAEYGNEYQAVDDDRGDGGNDGYLAKEKRMFARHCFKKLPKRDLDGAILTKIKADLAKAVERKNKDDYRIENWTFITNYAVPDHIIKIMKDTAIEEGIAALQKGPAYVAQLALKHRHILSEFPELEQVLLSEQIDRRFNGLEEKLPEPLSEKDQIIGKVNEVLRELLIGLLLHGEREVKPYLGAVNELMADADNAIQDKLHSIEKFFGETSNLYQQLESLSVQLHHASTAELSLDGGESYRKRMSYVKEALSLTQQLVQGIGDHKTLEMMDDIGIGVQKKLILWFQRMDDSYSSFFKEAATYAYQLMRVFSYFYQIGEDAQANRYMQLARDIDNLSRDNRSGYGTILDEELPKLKRRAQLLDLNDKEAELLVDAISSNGQLHLYRIDQVPPGHTLGIGAKRYGSDVDASVAPPYIEALEGLINKGFAQHVSGVLYTVTALGRRKVDI